MGSEMCIRDRVEPILPERFWALEMALITAKVEEIRTLLLQQLLKAYTHENKSTESVTVTDTFGFQLLSKLFDIFCCPAALSVRMSATEEVEEVPKKLLA